MPLTRRHFLATSTAALAAGTLGRVEFFAQVAPAQGTQPPAPVTPVFKELRRNTGYWTARGGTIGWLINPSGVIAVDSQFPDTAALCVEQLLKTSGKPDIAALINSHHHGDHTGGNGVFRPKTKQIIGHENVPKYMKSTFDQAVARRAQQNPPPTTPAADRTRRPGQDPDRRAGVRSRRRARLDEALRPRPHRRRHRHPLREGECRAHGGPDVQPRAPGDRSRQRRVDCELDEGASEGGVRTAGRHDLHLRACRGEVRGDRQPRGPEPPRELSRRAARLRARAGESRQDPRPGRGVDRHRSRDSRITVRSSRGRSAPPTTRSLPRADQGRLCCR